MQNFFKPLKISTFIISMLFIMPLQVLACSCMNPQGYYEYISEKMIIYKIRVNEANYSEEIVTNEDNKFKVQKVILQYEIIDNISNSKVPDNTPMVHIKSEVIEEELRPRVCECDSYTKRDYNTVDKFSAGKDYVVFVRYENTKKEMYVSEGLLIEDNKVVGDFGPYAKWENYQELREDLYRERPSIYGYEPAPAEQPTEESDSNDSPETMLTYFRVTFLGGSAFVLVALLGLIILLKRAGKSKKIILITFGVFIMYLLISSAFLLHVIWADGALWNRPWF